MGELLDEKQKNWVKDKLKEELLATVEVHLEEAQEHYHEILNPSLLSSTLESFGFINRKEQLAKAQQTVTETQELKKNGHLY